MKYVLTLRHARKRGDACGKETRPEASLREKAKGLRTNGIAQGVQQKAWPVSIRATPMAGDILFQQNRRKVFR